MAFYSGTDDNNDKSGIYYSGVIGKLTDTSFAHVIRFNLYEQKKECTLADVFDIEEKKVEVPKEWLDQVENKMMAPSGIGKPFEYGSRHRSLWDQSTNGLGSPWGYGYDFEEIDGESLGNWKGKDSPKKGGDQAHETDPIFDSYVPGPLDTLGMEDYSEVEDNFPGFDDGEVRDDYVHKYGKEAAESAALIDDFLVNLEDCDEPLNEIISTCYSMLSERAKDKIAHEGLRY